MTAAPQPEIVHLCADGLCDYRQAQLRMEELVARPPDAPDLLLCAEHPPTITVGRRGGREHIRSTRLGETGLEVPIYEVARGGSVTWHAPGQVVIYPIVRLAQLQGPLGRGPLGDLPLFARLLETAMQRACAACGLETCTREGFSGLWLDAQTKIGSLGVAIRGGWTWHGLALNVSTDLAGFELLTPCGLTGVRMTTLWHELDARGLARPTLTQVRDAVLAVLVEKLLRA